MTAPVGRRGVSPVVTTRGVWMYAYRYYLIAAPESPPAGGTGGRGVCGCYRVRSGEFTAVASGRQPDVTANVAKLLDTDGLADAGRALRTRSRGLPSGAGIYWRLNLGTGEAEGWRVKSPPAV